MGDLIDRGNLHGSSFETRQMIKRADQNSPIKRYRHLMFGPSRHIRFNKFAGKGLYHNNPTSLVYDHKLCGVSYSIATMNGPVMSHGAHYVSFTFHNCNGNYG